MCGRGCQVNHSLPFLLIGTDCEGDNREIPLDSLDTARELADRLTSRDGDGEPWRTCEIWGNNPVTETWEALESRLSIDDRFPREDRQHDVANGDTKLGYREWQQHNRESE